MAPMEWNDEMEQLATLLCNAGRESDLALAITRAIHRAKEAGSINIYPFVLDELRLLVAVD